MYSSKTETFTQKLFCVQNQTYACACQNIIQGKIFKQRKFLRFGTQIYQDSDYPQLDLQKTYSAILTAITIRARSGEYCFKEVANFDKT